jgi:hypothetical protein
VQPSPYRLGVFNAHGLAPLNRLENLRQVAADHPDLARQLHHSARILGRQGRPRLNCGSDQPAHYLGFWQAKQCDGLLQTLLIRFGQLSSEPRLSSQYCGGASHRRFPPLAVRTRLAGRQIRAEYTGIDEMPA